MGGGEGGCSFVSPIFLLNTTPRLFYHRSPPLGWQVVLSYRCSALAMSARASSDAVLTLSIAPTALLPTPSAAEAFRVDLTLFDYLFYQVNAKPGGRQHQNIERASEQGVGGGVKNLTVLLVAGQQQLSPHPHTVTQTPA